MSRVNKIALAFALLLSLNVIISSARARPGWDDFSEEEEEETKETDTDEEHDDHDDSKPGSVRALSPTGGHDHENHDHQLHVQQNPVPIANPNTNSGSDQAKQSGSWGGNVSNFNQSCDGSSGRICNVNSNLQCIANTCRCKPEHTYIATQERCYEVTNGDCEFNAQCHEGKWGYFSRCERTTGRCQCYDIDLSGKREVAFMDDTCVLKKSINEVCITDKECQGTMKDAYCAPHDPKASPSWTNATQTCQCQPGYIWDNLLEECLRIADQGLASDCKADIQCQAKFSERSRCSRETKKCECHDFSNPGQDNVVFYKKTETCYARKFWNETCSEHDECKASISSAAECLPNPADFALQLMCQCPVGKRCPLDADGDGAVGLGSNTFNIAIIVSFVIFTGFRT